jgi:hypothetical protein
VCQLKLGPLGTNMAMDELISAETRLLVEGALNCFAERVGIHITLAHPLLEKHYERLLNLRLSIDFFKAAYQGGEGCLTSGGGLGILASKDVVACLIGLKTSGALAGFPKLPAFHVTSNGQIIGCKFGNVPLSARPNIFPGLSCRQKVNGLDLIKCELLCGFPPSFKSSSL